MEAEGLRARARDFRDRNTELVGITFSSVEDLRAWREQLGLDCRLLSDRDRRVGIAYGAAETVDQEKAKRLSILIGPDARVRKTYPSPDPKTHAEDVLADL